jgi:hypothetical protein
MKFALWSHHRYGPYGQFCLGCYLSSFSTYFVILIEGVNCSSSFIIGGIVNNTLRPPVPETWSRVAVPDGAVLDVRSIREAKLH